MSLSRRNLDLSGRLALLEAADPHVALEAIAVALACTPPTATPQPTVLQRFIDLARRPIPSRQPRLFARHWWKRWGRAQPDGLTPCSGIADVWVLRLWDLLPDPGAIVSARGMSIDPGMVTQAAAPVPGVARGFVPAIAQALRWSADRGVMSAGGLVASAGALLERVSAEDPREADAAGAMARVMLEATLAISTADAPETIRHAMGVDGSAEAHDEGGAPDPDREAACAATLGVMRSIPRHRQAGVALAALLLVDRRPGGVDRGTSGDALAAWVHGPTDRGHAALLGVLRGTIHPIAGLRALRWADSPTLGQASRDRLSRPRTAMERDLVLEHGHLLMVPRRRAALARQGLAATARGSVDPWVAGTPEAWFGLTRWAGLIADPGRRAATLAPILAEADATTRHAAVRVLPREALADWCLDADARVAHAAAARAAAPLPDAPGSAGGPGPDRRLWSILRRSPHAEVRAWAMVEHERLMPHVGRADRLAACRLSHADPIRLVGILRQRLASRDAEEALGAAALARHLGLAESLAPELLALVRRDGTGPGERRAAATAASALGHARLRDHQALAPALHHQDARVRANTVEAWARLGADRGPLVELKDDGHHRVRANALRTLIEGSEPTDRADEADDSLRSMARDDRSMHRVAAAWAAGRAWARLVLAEPRPIPMLAGDRRQRSLDHWRATLGELARHDTEPWVRARATVAITRIDAAMHVAEARPPVPTMGGGLRLVHPDEQAIPA